LLAGTAGALTGDSIAGKGGPRVTASVIGALLGGLAGKMAGEEVYKDWRKYWGDDSPFILEIIDEWRGKKSEEKKASVEYSKEDFRKHLSDRDQYTRLRKRFLPTTAGIPGYLLSAAYPKTGWALAGAGALAGNMYGQISEQVFLHEKMMEAGFEFDEEGNVKHVPEKYMNKKANNTFLNLLHG
jgi:outer membrane lipoprotein SlyB